jgi:hypothetical protein
MPLVASLSPLTPPTASVLVNPLGSSQGQAWDADRASSAIIPAGYQSPLEPAKPGPPMTSVGGAAVRGAEGSDANCQNVGGGRNDPFTSIQQRLRAPPISCWSRGDLRDNSIGSTAKWRLAAIRTTTAILRQPIQMPFG